MFLRTKGWSAIAGESDRIEHRSRSNGQVKTLCTVLTLVMGVRVYGTQAASHLKHTSVGEGLPWIVNTALLVLVQKERNQSSPLPSVDREVVRSRSVSGSRKKDSTSTSSYNTSPKLRRATAAVYLARFSGVPIIYPSAHSHTRTMLSGRSLLKHAVAPVLRTLPARRTITSTRIALSDKLFVVNIPSDQLPDHRSEITEQHLVLEQSPSYPSATVPCYNNLPHTTSFALSAPLSAQLVRDKPFRRALVYPMLSQLYLLFC